MGASSAGVRSHSAIMTTAAPGSDTSPPPAPRRGVFARMRATRAGFWGMWVSLIVVVACVASIPWTFARGDDGARAFEAQNRAARLHAPGWTVSRGAEADRAPAPAGFHAMGTDLLGRDLLTRVLAGGAISLLVGIAAAGVSVSIGTAYGLLAGYASPRVDAVMMRIVDVLYGLPSVLLVVLLAVASDSIIERAVAGGVRISEAARQAWDLATLLVAIGGVSWLTMARVVRGQVLSLKTRPFMEAARALGLPVHRQLLRHLLPSLLGTIVVYATLTVPQAILQESFLSFLGLGIKPPLPSWGTLAADGLQALSPINPAGRWWLLAFPSLALAVTLLAMNFLGEGLREAMGPK